jgi:hypothetical protein
MSTLPSSSSSSSSTSSSSSAPADDILRSSFRGRLLRGKTLPLPSDYQGTTTTSARASAGGGLSWQAVLTSTVVVRVRVRVLVVDGSRAGAPGGHEPRQRGREAVARGYSHLALLQLLLLRVWVRWDGRSDVTMASTRALRVHSSTDHVMCHPPSRTVCRVDVLESRHTSAPVRPAPAVDGLAASLQTGTPWIATIKPSFPLHARRERPHLPSP